MQQLMILRHAEAVGWSSQGDDFSRSLSDSGLAHAERISTYISRELELPEEILCSPAVRARQTLAPLLALEPELQGITRIMPPVYNAAEETLFSLLDFAFAESDRILIVGHNPGFGVLASKLVADPDESPFPGLPTGTLVVIDFDPGWTPGVRHGRLNRRVTPDDLSGD